MLEIEGLEVQPGGLTRSRRRERALAAGSTVREKRAELDVATRKIKQTTVQFFPRVTPAARATHYIPTARRTVGQGRAIVGAQNAAGRITRRRSDGAGHIVRRLRGPAGGRRGVRRSSCPSTTTR